MNDSTVFVGLDYHQASVQVCVENRSGEVLLNRRCRNDWAAIVEAVRPCGPVARVAGNRELRATLIEAAHRLIRFDRKWGGFASTLLARGKPKCVVVAAVANRWVRWLFHQMQPARLRRREV